MILFYYFFSTIIFSTNSLLPTSLFLLGGLLSGLLAGLLGIGGGTLLVPLLLLFNYTYPQAVASSSLAIVFTSISGSIQNWRMGYINLKKVLLLGLPSVVTAYLGAYLVPLLPKSLLEGGFALLMLLNIYLTFLRTQLNNQQVSRSSRLSPIIAGLITGTLAGLLSGLFGIGGGVILVPLQMLLLGESIKSAIQTSLGVIVITSLASCLGHLPAGNLLFSEGFLLGMGGLLGATISSRFLPRLSDSVVQFFFCSYLACMSVYFFWRALNS